MLPVLLRMQKIFPPNLWLRFLAILCVEKSGICVLVLVCLPYLLLRNLPTSGALFLWHCIDVVERHVTFSAQPGTGRYHIMVMVVVVVLVVVG